MFLRAFADELARCGTPALVKTARLRAPKAADRMLERMVATGALGSTALYGAQKLQAGLTRDPWDGPQGGIGMAAAKGAGGGALAAALVGVLSRLNARKG